MLIVTLVATMAGGMVWLQWRAVQVEAAERARDQSAWILAGALDWARLILREDLRADSGSGAGGDHLGEPWAVPLAEARLSTFLAADQSNNASDDDAGPEAFLSGLIVDAQSRYNLRNLLDEEGKLDPKQFEVLQKLCTSAGLDGDVAQRIAQGLADAARGEPGAPLPPQDLDQLGWFGVSQAAIDKLRPWLALLPGTEATPVNLNTAPREVLAAVVPGMDLGGAEHLIDARQRSPFKKIEDAKPFLPTEPPPDPKQVSVKSSYFEVQGRLRLDDRVLEERSLVFRNQNDMQVLQRERVSRSSSLMP